MNDETGKRLNIDGTRNVVEFVNGLGGKVILLLLCTHRGGKNPYLNCGFNIGGPACRSRRCKRPKHFLPGPAT
jgi:hypothetical protein